MSAVTESFTVQQWSAPCGPAPVTGTAQPGGAVRLRTDGGEFAIEGGRRTLRTDGCLDGMPTLSREAHSTSGRSWRTRCSTPPSDPRRAVVNTAYFLTSDDTIQVAETGRYELTINDARCIADVKRDASLPRRSPLRPRPGAAVDRRRSRARRRRSRRRAPRRRPRRRRQDRIAARRTLRPASRSARRASSSGSATRSRFRAVVLDATGCPTGTPIQWAIGALRFKDGQAHPTGPAIDASGKRQHPARLRRRDVRRRRHGGGTERASVGRRDVPGELRGAARRSRASTRNGERDEPAVAILATGSIGASDVRAEDGARRRRHVFIVVVGGLAVALAIVAAIGIRALAQGARGRASRPRSGTPRRCASTSARKRDREETHAAQLRAHLESVATAQRAAAEAAARGIDTGPMFCPSCRREFSGGGAYCPFDSNRLVAIAGHEISWWGRRAGCVLHADAASTRG